MTTTARVAAPLTDREKITAYVECLCVIQGLVYIERDTTLTVPGIVKYTFHENGDLRSVIRNGRNYKADSVSPYSGRAV